MIKLLNLQKVIGQRTLLDIELLDVREGEIVGIIGPPGSGKSTIFDLLVGATPASGGTVSINGLDPHKEWDRLAHEVGILFEQDRLYTRLSVEENLKFAGRLLGIRTDAIPSVLHRVGLADLARNKLSALSPGLQRRLAFGRAIIHSPGSLILVEPFARCDEVTIRLLRDLIVNLAEEGTSILILAEDPQHLMGILDRRLYLERGQLIEKVNEEVGGSGQQPFKIPVREEGRVTLLNPGDVLFADVEDGRAFLTTVAGERLQTQFTLSELGDRLERKGFFRAHRSYLVNLQHVTEVIPFTRNSYSLRLDNPDGTLIPLSKSAAADLRDLLDF